VLPETATAGGWTSSAPWQLRRLSLLALVHLQMRQGGEEERRRVVDRLGGKRGPGNLGFVEFELDRIEFTGELL
jgi:hypothetical protein